MRIEFKKIGKAPKKFHVKKDDIEFFGEFKKDKNSLVDIKGTIKNRLEVQCDRCAKNFFIDLNEKIELKASDGIFNGEIEEIDVIEFYDGFVDFDKILESEIESIKLDYHICEECSKNKDFSFEFN